MTIWTGRAKRWIEDSEVWDFKKIDVHSVLKNITSVNTFKLSYLEYRIIFSSVCAVDQWSTLKQTALSLSLYDRIHKDMKNNPFFYV
jgi:hypothetical protein